MSTSASQAETGHFTYEAIAALVPTLEGQHTRAASSASSPSTTASTPEAEEECRALEAEFLVDLHDDSDASPSTSASADSLAEQASGPLTAPASASATMTPYCRDLPQESSMALSPLALNDDLAPVAHAPNVESSATTAADFEQAPSTYPTSNPINGLALRALLQTVNDFRPLTPMLSPNAKARLARWEKDVNFHEPGTNDAVHLPNDDSYTNGAVLETQEPLCQTPTTTPRSANLPLGPSPVLLAVNAEMAPAGAETVAHYAPALGVEATTPDAVHALCAAPPSDVVNAQALHALLQASANSAGQAVPTHNHGYPASAQHGAYLTDAALPPAHAFPLLAQSQSHFGVPQGYPAAPPTAYPQPGAPHLSYYGPQVPQQYQYGYYSPYAPNGLGLVFGGAPPQYAVPGFPMQYQSTAPVPHLSAKPLSATGRPNEPAGLPQGQVAAATSSSKRKRPVPDWKGKGKAKAIEENVDADAASAVNDNRDDNIPPAKKPRRAARGSKGAARQPQPTRKNRSYTLLPDGKYKCSHCGDDTIKNKNKHRQMCGLEGPLRCPFCGLELMSRRHDSLKRHLKFSECKNNPNAVAAAAAIAASRSASAGTELASTYNDAAQETQGENDSGAEEDVDAYRNVAGPSSVTLEDIPKPKKKATKKKAAKKN